VIDPRTGEVIKGNVLLGSLRIRQDLMIGTSLEGPYARGSDSDGPRAGIAGEHGNRSRWAEVRATRCEAASVPDASYLTDDPAAGQVQLALARIRQLAAHEVGHALGFEHNFAASSYGRASVMDYPAPMAVLRNGRIDLSEAYATGVGRYDVLAVRYAYSQFAPGTEESLALDAIVHEGIGDGLLFVDDADGRPGSGAHPLASLWDNGTDPVAMLHDQLEIRRVALERFGLSALPDRQPVSLLEARLVPLYLHHRYQLQAALKWVGGLFFTYAVKEDGRAVPGDVRKIVAPADERRALAAVLDTLDPAVLVLPQRILDLIPPPAAGYRAGTAELFPRATAPAFDPISAAVAAADLAISGLLHPARAARLEQFHAEQPASPAFQEVVAALIERTWRPGASSSAAADPQGMTALVTRAVQTLTVDRLMDLAADEGAAPTCGT
jgi:hypothetical protein